jgi:DIS3-like exonuclease 1
VASRYPHGHYAHQLGEIGRVDTEMAALLVENEVVVGEFSPKMIEGIPFVERGDSWAVPAAELRNRRDMRQERVFSIDPLGSQDIDDALSVRFLDDKRTRVEIGVHIADVSFFVKPGSLLDLEARARSTTVYLADRKFEMLPRMLSEGLCSLRELVDRPALSVIWEFDVASGRVLNTWFGRTIIRSCHELYYERAQRVLDDQTTDDDRRVLPDLKQLKPELELLTALARILQRNRIERGAVELESTEIRFAFGSGSKTAKPIEGNEAMTSATVTEERMPAKIEIKRQQEINQVVAEWMIFANECVAKRIYTQYPSAALLRHHSAPSERKLKVNLEKEESGGEGNKKYLIPLIFYLLFRILFVMLRLKASLLMHLQTKH